MPSQWFVEIPGLDLTLVRLEHVHAAFTRWFDGDAREHAANDKPYVVSPPTTYEGDVGVQIATVTEDAESVLACAVRKRREVRLGNQVRRVGAARLLRRADWSALRAGPYEQGWRLEFLSPTTFRSGDRASPYPQVGTILSGLDRAWRAFATVPPTGYGCCDGARGDGLWVSDLDLCSQVLRLRVGGRDGVRREVVVPGVLGWMTLRCDQVEVAARVAPLLRLAPFVGVGGFRLRGLGVVEVQPVLGPHAPGGERAS